LLRNSTKVRGTIHADVDKTAPQKVHWRAFEAAEKRSPCAAPSGFTQIERGLGGVTDPSAKQHAVISTKAEVVEDEIVVTGGCIAGNQLHDTVPASSDAVPIM
jgi:hypothetical protein